MDDLFRKIKNNNSSADTAIVKRAYLFAQTAHGDQKRASGMLTFSHSETVAKTLADWRLDGPTIAAGLLHDTIEYGAANQTDIEKNFDPTVSQLVAGVTKVGEIQLRGSTKEEFVENLRKMFLAMAKDLRVVFIKLASRLHNMETLQYLPEEKKLRIAKETLEIYAPLAERLGMGQVKGQLEDLSFLYLFPKQYDWLINFAAPAYKNAQIHVDQARRKLLTAFAQEKISAEVHGRKKHHYSLYLKLLRPEINKELSLIYDLVALRVIVRTVEDCYCVLGLIHKIFKPVTAAGGVRDYIAVPKPNGYQSIHTNVIGPKGRIIEIQIRTQQMHEEAELGLASHLHYAAKKSRGASDQELESGKIGLASKSKLAWVRQLANWQKEIADNQEFIQGLKFDALSHRIFVLTPKGDVKDLPVGATPIDFAYAVHSELGDRTIGAKVNDKMVSLNYKLKSGDVCEVVLAKKSQKPNTDWLAFVITHLAKKEIQKGLRTPI